MYHIGHIPIVVGGTGFWAEALLGGGELPQVAPNRALRARLSKKSAAQLFAQLRRLDPRRAGEIDPRNSVRLIRAIEIAKALGSVPPTHTPLHTPLKKHSDILKNVRMFDVLWLGLTPHKDILHKNIRARIRARLKKGMCAEAKRLRATLSKKRFLALGAEFSLLAEYLDGTLSRKELEEKLAAWEYSYAKRQMRWYRKNTKIHWLEKKTRSEALSSARKFLGTA